MVPKLGVITDTIERIPNSLGYQDQLDLAVHQLNKVKYLAGLQIHILIDCLAKRGRGSLD